MHFFNTQSKPPTAPPKQPSRYGCGNIDNSSIDNLLSKDDKCTFIPVAKPPLGVSPKYIYELQRIQNLSRAIHEYAFHEKSEKNYKLMLEWSNELTERIESLIDSSITVKEDIEELEYRDISDIKSINCVELGEKVIYKRNFDKVGYSYKGIVVGKIATGTLYFQRSLDILVDGQTIRIEI